MAAEDYANRLRKNLKKFEVGSPEGIECYRLYDADLPEYNVAVDRYADWVVVQEYAPPKLLMRTKRVSVVRYYRCNYFGTGDCAKQTGTETRERQKGKISTRNWARRASFWKLPNITLTCG